MKLYHGSYLEVASPDVLHSRDRVDFGPGFYTTPLLEQASKWCQRFKRTGRAAVVSAYEFDTRAYGELECLDFDSYNEAWLDFVVRCRRGEAVDAFDIVRGGMADDKVFNTIELFFDGLIPKGEAIKRLRFEQPNYQVCFKTQTAIDRYLRFERSFEL